MEFNIKGSYHTEGMELREKEGIPFLIFPHFERTGLVRQGFSTRLGGVSRNEFSSMNFSASRGDDPAAVQENYKRMMHVLEMEQERLVLSHQTHTTNIRVVSEADAGKGFNRERDYEEIDGLMTDRPGLPLVTFYADCIPLYFLDPVHKAIALSHAGWRGTVAGMAAITIRKMGDVYGSKPGDLLVGIGPGICGDCYEVGPEVAEAFLKDWPEDICREILKAKDNGKYQLDLKWANA